MKAILKEDYKANSLLNLLKGEEVEIIDSYCGCDSYTYKCIVSDGSQQFIDGNLLEIIDYTPTKDWEQIKIKASIAAMQGIVSNPDLRGNPEDYANDAVLYADKLIEELKKSL